MGKVKKRTFSLTEQQSDYIDRKVASGTYASGSEVMREGLRAMQARDAAIERWLVEQVVPAHLELKAHPERAMPAEQVFDELEAELLALAKAAE